MGDIFPDLSKRWLEGAAYIGSSNDSSLERRCLIPGALFSPQVGQVEENFGKTGKLKRPIN